MTRADAGSRSAKIIETHSPDCRRDRSVTDDFGRFASAVVRAPDSSRPERRYLRELKQGENVDSPVLRLISQIHIGDVLQFVPGGESLKWLLNTYHDAP